MHEQLYHLWLILLKWLNVHVGHKVYISKAIIRLFCTR